MTRKHSPACLLILSCAAIFMCAGFQTVCAQELPPNPATRSSAVRATQMQGARGAMLKATAKRSSSRKLVKIRTRAGDTLSLLGDRFGIPAEEIATLNGIAVSAQLQSNRELLIPLPSPEMLARESADKLAQHNSNLSGANTVASVEADGGWENVQGVLFRKGSAARTNISNQASMDESNRESNEAKDAPLTKIVEVSEAERSNATQPVWIYLVGGARVEADSVNETAEGVWYTHGNLSIFIERSRIERIERERVKSVSESSDSWKERGWSTGNPKFDALIRENGSRFGVDPYLIFCVMEQESQFKPRIVSPKGARGLMQLMPGTAARFGVRRPFEPAENIMGGTRYLKQLLENFGGRVDLVLAGYNAGEGAVMKFGGNVPPYRETRNYVQRISKRYGQSRSSVAPATETPIVAAQFK
ncbi:MAG TPA: transglycosylase SLT domain-containing protein [Pyrinomonadaceae bacterium]|nr:transglycosylase SLT domain-containing protein [Pyrinomonadaceae bacterium]